MDKKPYSKPHKTSEKSFETSAMSCGKTNPPPSGSRHLVGSHLTHTAYSSSTIAGTTFTGHLGPGFGGNSSETGSGGVGWPPGAFSFSYGYSGFCSNWVSIAS